LTHELSVDVLQRARVFRDLLSDSAWHSRLSYPSGTSAPAAHHHAQFKETFLDWAVTQLEVNASAVMPLLRGGVEADIARYDAELAELRNPTRCHENRPILTREETLALLALSVTSNKEPLLRYLPIAPVDYSPPAPEKQPLRHEAPSKGPRGSRRVTAP
jgi:hypothetical protein